LSLEVPIPTLAACCQGLIAVIHNFASFVIAVRPLTFTVRPAIEHRGAEVMMRKPIKFRTDQDPRELPTYGITEAAHYLLSKAVVLITPPPVNRLNYYNISVSIY